MVFLKKEITQSQFKAENLDPIRFKGTPLYQDLIKHDITYWKAELTESDFEKSLNIYYNGHRAGLPIGWQLLSPEKECKVSKIAKIILESKYKLELKEEQENVYISTGLFPFVNRMRVILSNLEKTVRNFDDQENRRFTWVLVSYSLEGPFWLYDRNNKALAAYIFGLIDNDYKFRKMDNCVCAISFDKKLPYFIPILRR